MHKLMARFKHAYYCYKNDIPTKYRVLDAYKILCAERSPTGPRILGITSEMIMYTYFAGADLQEVAEAFKLPRERVRQVLWRIVRRAKLPRKTLNCIIKKEN